MSLVFSKFCHDARNPEEVVRDRAGFSRKNFFAPKTGKMGQKWAKNRGFFTILKKFVINFDWICYIMKIFIFCCVPAQIRYLGKFWFLRYGPKCSQPIRLQDFLIKHLSRINQRNSLIFLRAWSEMCVASLVTRLWRMNWRNELIFCMLEQIQES